MTEVTPGSDSASERPHALVVTADEDLKSFLGEGLMYGGFWISVVASGLQTLEVFRLRGFDLVLIDADLPGIGAVEVTRRLRGQSLAAEAPARNDVPVVLIAADAAAINPKEVAAAGFTEMLAAPLELEELVPHLHTIVTRWRRDHPGRPWADQAAQTGTDQGPSR